MQQFIGYDDGLSCPIVPSQGRSISLALAQSSTSYYNSFMDNKPSEKHQSKHRIGNTFRNSWGRKDSEHKAAKKSTSLVIFSLIDVSSISHLLNEQKHYFWSQLMQQSGLHTKFFCCSLNPFSLFLAKKGERMSFSNDLHETLIE